MKRKEMGMMLAVCGMPDDIDDILEYQVRRMSWLDEYFEEF